MIVEDKDIEIFCIINEFNKNFNAELDKNCFFKTVLPCFDSMVRYSHNIIGRYNK